MFLFWSKPTEKALRDLQEAKRVQLEAHEAAVQRMIAQAHKDPDVSAMADTEQEGVWIDTGSGPGYVRRSVS